MKIILFVFMFVSSLAFSQVDEPVNGIEEEVPSPGAFGVNEERLDLGTSPGFTKDEMLSNPRRIALIKIGTDNDVSKWHCVNFVLPSRLLDADGGTIRLILQHKVDANDQLRVIDEDIVLEYKDDTYGPRGRNPNGLYGWTREGGSNTTWILNDNIRHTIASPWDWIKIADSNIYGDNKILTNNEVRACTHPHVAARVILLD